MNYDIIVMGSGPGGYVAAIKAAQLGAKVAIVEKDSFGGVCLNWGCIPTKALLKNAKVYQYILNASKYGIDISDSSSITLNWGNMLSRKAKVVDKLTSGVEYLLKKNKVDIYRGFATALDKNSVEINGEIIRCKNLIISTGSSPIMPEIPGIKEGLARGFVATLYSALGTKVTIVQNIEKILEFLDHDVTAEMEGLLKKNNVDILYNSSILKVEGNKILIKGEKGEKILTPDYLLISIGRAANLKGLENLSLKTYRRGVITNNKTETCIPGVYAIGDVNGIFNLAHVASAEGIVAVENILNEKGMTINYNKVPNCTYTSPEMAAAGYNEADARNKFNDIIVSKFPLSANGKALAEGEDTGFIKIIAEAEYGEIVGVHIVAPTATDMISEIVTTMELEGTLYDLAKTIHPHPSLSEIVMEAAHGALGKPIHM